MSRGKRRAVVRVVSCEKRDRGLYVQKVELECGHLAVVFKTRRRERSGPSIGYCCDPGCIRERR